MKDYLELKNSTDKLERTVYWIMQLSPHNAWKAVDALKELQEEAITATRERDIEVVESTAIDMLDGPSDEPESSKTRRQLAQALRNLE